MQGKNDYSLSSKVGRLLSADYPVHTSQLGAFVTPSKLNVRYDYSYDGAMRSLEQSLGRMQVAKIDIALIHDPDTVGATVKEVVSGCGKALLELREQGVIGAVGAGMNQWQMPLELAKAAPFDVFLLAGRYTLLEQESLPFMEYCAQHGISVLIGGVFNSGLLINPNQASHYNYAPVSQAVLSRALALQEVCLGHGVPLRAAALQFPFRHKAVANVIVAARNVMQLEDNLAMINIFIPPELWTDLMTALLLEKGL